MKKVRIGIEKIPSAVDLERLHNDVTECLTHYDGNNSLLYDHLENSIARVLGQEVPNKELEVN